MKAAESNILKFLSERNQFTIPIYQRTYGWEKKQCEQLWNDIIKTAEENNEGHFIGSIVYITKGLYEVSSIPQILVIDGQQRLTTISLLLAALAKVMDDTNYSGEIDAKRIRNYHLFNQDEEGEKKYKLILTEGDKQTIINVLERRDPPSNLSANVINTYELFLDKIEKYGKDLGVLFRGIQKLLIVGISLDQTTDDPQLIFESLNSTGLDLSKSDLIRNFILMGIPAEKQEMIYKNYWYPMQQQFSKMEKDEFDKFMRYFLNVQTGNDRIVSRNIYPEFKVYWNDKNDFEEATKRIFQFSKYYANLYFGTFEDEKVSKISKNIKELKADVVYPFLLAVVDDLKNGHVTEPELIEIFSLVESYVLRRAICDFPTNSMNRTFAGFVKDVEKEDYLNSVKFLFRKKERHYKFPDDAEFKKMFVVKDVYRFLRKSYLLRKLENFDTKEPVEVKNYTIEHIMPQNPHLIQQWRNDLGENWVKIQSDYLHTIGNLTFTGYNPEYSDKSFQEKKTMTGGFSESPIRLNKSLAGLEKWDEEEIKKRADELADLALKIWKYPILDKETQQKFEDKEILKENATAVEAGELDEEKRKEKEPIKRYGPWSVRYKKASQEAQKLIQNTISRIDALNDLDEFECHGLPKYNWYFFYADEDEEEKFAILSIGKNVANLYFRIDPETFSITDEKIRTVNGFFWPGTERRIGITSENSEVIMKCVKHAYEAAIKFESEDR